MANVGVVDGIIEKVAAGVIERMKRFDVLMDESGRVLASDGRM